MLSTKDLSDNKKPSKMIQPGNHTCKILSITLQTMPYDKDACNLILQVEGPDLGDKFKGFFIDKDNPSKGYHKGQIGRLRASEYPFADKEFDDGTKIFRDREIMKFIKNLCLALGELSWIQEQDGKHPTIQSFIDKFNADKLYEGKFLRMCIGGKKYQNLQGYTNHDLFLPRPNKLGFAFESESVPEAMSKLAVFDPLIHITEKKPKATKSFKADTPVTQKTKDQFSL